MIAHEKVFLYDNESMITEMYVSELNENISIYGLIVFLGKTTNKDNKLHLITSKNKLKFNLKNGVYKDKIELKLIRLAHLEIMF